MPSRRAAGGIISANRQLRGSLKQVKELIRLRPRNPYWHDVLASTLFQAGDFQGALRDIDNEIRLDPLDAVTRLKKAVILQQKGDLGRAMKEYERIVSFSQDARGHTSRYRGDGKS